ncbi:MAG: tRNA pseudouridine(55) synthase TruB [Pseudomonadota bacterium]
MKKRKGIPIHGWVNLNKPAGIGSTQALAKVRRVLNAQKAGHGGTLDPLADGILPIALGEATKTVNYAQDALKTYRFTVTWGEQRSTDDAEGEIIATSDIRPNEDDIKAILPNFTGDIDQIPPKFSAIKVDGQRAYDLARDGEEVELKSRSVYIESLQILEHSTHTISFECVCGKGTYIRSLARDMAQKLGTCGYISALSRTQVGPLTLKNAISLDFFDEMPDNTPIEDIVLPVETVLDDIPALALKDQEASRLKHGNPLSFIAKPDMDRLKMIGIIPGEPATALATYEGRPLALIEVDGPDIKVRRILNI